MEGPLWDILSVSMCSWETYGQVQLTFGAQVLVDQLSFLVDLNFSPTIRVFPTKLHNYLRTLFLEKQIAVLHLQEAFLAMTGPTGRLRAVGHHSSARM